jgi:hypothetical protein
MTTPFNAAYTFPQHRISVTDNLRAGNAVSAAMQLLGVPVSLKQFENLGAVNVKATNTTGVLSVNIVLSSTAFASAGSVAPNTAPTGGSLVGGVATFDFPRNVQIASSNTGDTTQTVTITGTDYYGAPMTQAMTLNGETSVNSTKAFYTINNIAVSATMAGNLTVGAGAAFGLSYALLGGTLPVGSKVTAVGPPATVSADAGTVVYPDTTSPATSTTGDVRGTYTPAATPNGTTIFYVEYQTAGGPLNVNAFGQPQA